ncbi:Phosphoglycerate mutase family protein, partial [Globisporangium splendens]
MTDNKTLYCIRHGESTFNEWRKRSLWNFSWMWVRDPMIIDAPLSTKGNLQAQELHKLIKERKLDEQIGVIITSPLTRAIQTMMGGFQETNIPILYLAESFQGLNVDFQALEPFWWLPPQKRQPASGSTAETLKSHEDVLPLRETTADVDARIKELLTKLNELPETHIAIVGHSSFFKRMLGMNRKLHNCELYEAPFADIAKRYGIQTE